MRNSLNHARILAILLATAASQPGVAIEVQVTLENLAPGSGVYLTPIWLGFHDGSFDTFDPGELAGAGLESVAEDGVFDTFRAEFSSAAPNGTDVVLVAPGGFAGAPVFDPSDRVTAVIDLDPANQRFLSFAGMLLPSNDAFIANEGPREHEIFNDSGEFVGPISFIVFGEQVWDAGTEDNTESDAAFFDQTAPDSGDSTADGIALHVGFNGSVGNPTGTPVNFLGGTSSAGVHFDADAADFTVPAYTVARITVSSATVDVRVTVENLRPEGGTYLTPLWIGAHDGDFDLYDMGATASPGLEQLAEDGAADILMVEFDEATGGAGVQALITDPPGFTGAPVIDPGNRASTVISLDPTANRYLSYATMVIPSNDAFLGNDNPQGLSVFDDDGRVVASRRVLSNQRVRDAGTEVNNETDAAFLNQAAANTGEDEGGTIQVHAGLNGSVALPGGSPVNILGGTNGGGVSFDVTSADFARNGELMAAIEISPVVDASFGGTWFSPERAGEGLLIEIVDDSDPTVVVSFYTYAADGSGNPLWLIGSGPLINDTALVELVSTDGATFGDAFDPSEVVRTPWGQVRIRFASCSEAELEVTANAPGFDSYSHSISRLTPAPLGLGGHCSR